MKKTPKNASLRFHKKKDKTKLTKINSIGNKLYVICTILAIYSPERSKLWNQEARVLKVRY